MKPLPHVMVVVIRPRVGHRATKTPQMAPAAADVAPSARGTITVKLFVRRNTAGGWEAVPAGDGGHNHAVRRACMLILPSPEEPSLASVTAVVWTHSLAPAMAIAAPRTAL